MFTQICPGSCMASRLQLTKQWGAFSQTISYVARIDSDRLLASEAECGAYYCGGYGATYGQDGTRVIRGEGFCYLYRKCSGSLKEYCFQEEKKGTVSSASCAVKVPGTSYCTK